MTVIIPGKTTFRSFYGDSNALFRVVSSRGGESWNCVIDTSNVDYAGTRKVFGTEEIKALIERDKAWDKAARTNETFWASRQVGEVLHYENGRYEWVRGEIVEGFDRDGKPGKVLRPTGLVGDWREHDLPRWYDSGRYNDGGYYVQMLRNGETFQPNSSNIFEYKVARGDRVHVDPRTMDVWDISAPQPTQSQAEAAMLLRKIEAVQLELGATVASEGVDYATLYRKRLNKAAEIIADEDFGLERRGPKF